MLSLPPKPGADVQLMRHWRAASAADAAALIPSGVTVAVGWMGDSLATALADSFRAHEHPNSLTLVYGATLREGRNHGLNLLAHEGLVRRVVGGQWHPVPGLQALAAANRIEAYSFPVGIINRLFRDVADGLPGHLSRNGLGTFTDPRNGGGRLNRRTQEQLVRLVHPAGDEALLFHGFPIDAAIIGVAFMEGTAAIAMTRESRMIARAARKGGGIVIAQLDRTGTLGKLPAGQVLVPDTLIDVLVSADPHDRVLEMFASSPNDRNRQQPRIAH
ncbi:MAG: propionate CoA-transferase [Acetobacteraceae bacterium]|jgi:propionate CoA-transferase|nr:propionate CoA-transferase [Acetobacteraceae bacterium]